jgi:glycosyltransferase involved in cell wall biosynthesis
VTLPPPLEVVPRVLYAAFDVYPSAKGAAQHISEWAGTLFRAAGGGVLAVLGEDGMPRYQREGDVQIVRHVDPVPNMLARTLSYGAALGRLVEPLAETLALAHFRDPWSGLPLLAPPKRAYRTVYEVNGLPSIELPYRYPRLGASTLEKIRALELHCLARADAIVTPSTTVRELLVRLGVDPGRIAVIPNGASPRPEAARPADAPARYILYAGALQRWQGVHVLLKALARLVDEPVQLVVCAARSKRARKGLEKLAAKLGVAARVHWKISLPKDELAAWVQHAELTVAPLTECSRNVEQGCCPLKILESMMAGTPVVASDLPAVRELVEDERHGVLVPPDRPAELARAIRVLAGDPERRARVGAAARERALEHFTWDASNRALAALYARLGVGA